MGADLTLVGTGGLPSGWERAGLEGADEARLPGCEAGADEVAVRAGLGAGVVPARLGVDIALGGADDVAEPVFTVRATVRGIEDALVRRFAAAAACCATFSCCSRRCL